MSDFDKIFRESIKQLNNEQREAVEAIDGPVLVIAGPGTGKTQLLSIRIANILRQTDTNPSNILAVTFTDSGASNMRERLSRFIGSEAFKVGIFTYHAFANDIIANYPEYFITKGLDNLADDLTRNRLMTEALKNIKPYGLLSKNSTTVGGFISTVSSLKKELISPKLLEEVCKQNIEIDNTFNILIKNIDTKKLGGGGKVNEKLEIYGDILGIFQDLSSRFKPVSKRIPTTASILAESLTQAMNEAEESGNTKPLTSWKDKYLSKKSKDNTFMLDYSRDQRMLEFSRVYDDYTQKMKAEGLYDYDDMILEAINAIEKNDDLRFTLQEKYQYILLDEYQDTNESQSKIIELLTDNPVNEGRPNVLAVGDDDQAIYAFQGALSSNMLDFYNRYRDVKIVNLVKNYRSHPEILEVGKNIASQITDRLTKNLPVEIDKDIQSGREFTDSALIEKIDFHSQPEEFSWTAKKVQDLIQSGIKPSEIAILCPRHKHLQNLAPYFKQLDLPISYEKKEDILEDKTIDQIIKIAKLAKNIREKSLDVDSLFPEVLSFDFWDIPPTEIWKLSWKANKDRSYWLEEIQKSECENLRRAGQFLIEIAVLSKTKSLEQMLDIILGTEQLNLGGEDINSPLREFIAENDEVYYDTLLNLTVLRDRLREFSGERNNSLDDLISFADAYKDADIKITNTNPHKTTDNAVQFMTPFQAKGLEFSHVFLISANKEVWNSNSGGNNSLSIPINLSFIGVKDNNEDTRKRVFFVAATRAKSDLYITSYLKSFNGKNATVLEFLSQNDSSGDVRAQIIPEKFSLVQTSEKTDLPIQDAETNWHDFYKVHNEKMKDLLKARNENYKISPTHVNSFVDLEYAGPQAFYENTILRFPSAYSIDSSFGTIVHDTLNQAQIALNNQGSYSADQLIASALNKIEKSQFTQEEKEELRIRLESTLSNIFKNKQYLFKKGYLSEQNFSSEGVTIGEARLTGKIDSLRIDEENKEITVVDFKTGKIPVKNNSDQIDNNSLKIHKYEQQLYFYKILVENTPKFAGYKVKAGAIEFIEPSAVTDVSRYEIPLSPEKENHIKDLIQAVYHNIKEFNFDIDTSKFKKTKPGVVKFEDYLISTFKEEKGE